MTNEKIEKRNFLGVGFYRCASTICESMIKAFGAVFIYKSSGKLSYVMYYMMIYSLVQILTNVLLNKFFCEISKNFFAFAFNSISCNVFAFLF